MDEIRRAVFSIINWRERLHGKPINAQQFRQETVGKQLTYRPAANWAGETLVTRQDAIDEAICLAWLIVETVGRSPYKAASYAVSAVMRGERLTDYCQAPAPTVRQLVAEGYTWREAKELAADYRTSN